nr:ATP-dependent zinc metalloprotease FtsH [Spiroplasma alleghenense]
MKNKKKSYWWWLILAFAVMILTLWIISAVNGAPQELSANSLMNYLNSGEYVFFNVSVSYGENGVVTISGTLQNIADSKSMRFFTNMGSSTYDDFYNNQPAFAQLITHAKVVVPSGVTFLSVFISLLPIIILVVLYVVIFRSMSKGAGGGAGGVFGMGKNRARETKSDIKFSDIAGISEEKQELVELVDYLKNPKKYSEQGARAPKGVLMEGPPGTGKTLLAKAVAGEAGVAFFSISGSEFEEMFVGVGASRVREMFTEAKKAAPCIIFIDEIDAVGRKRSQSVGMSGSEQTLNQLLVEMDGFGTNSGVIVMAATNRVDVLDAALLRPGRFDRTIQISLPDIREREAILKLHARNKIVSPSIDWKRIAERTPGFSGAQLENVLNEAAILVVREGKKLIGLAEIDEAIDRVVGGPAKRSRAMTLLDKDIVSYHEAGHALIGLKLESANKVQKVTIIPRGNAGGYTIMTPKDESVFSSKEDLFASITGYLGGRAAEEFIFGKNKITTGAHDDLDKATNIARRMVTQFGMSSLGLTKFLTMSEEAYGQTKGVYSDETALKIDLEVQKILEACYKSSLEIIKGHKKTLELIAESLRILETITAEQIDYINEKNKLPVEVEEEKARQKENKRKEENGEILEFTPDE